MSYCEEHKIREVLRVVYWHEARAKLLCILETYWGEGQDFDKVYDLIHAFIKELDEELE